MMGHLGEVSNAAVAVNARREQPSVPSVLSRAMVAVWGMHREDRSRISPVTLRACKPRPAMRAYDGSRLVFRR